MLKKLVFIFDLWKAYSLSGIDDKQALFLLNKHCIESEKYKNKFPDYFILKGSLNYNMKNYFEAQQDFEMATELLTSNKYYNIDEKKYLYSYIYNHLANILYYENNQEWITFDKLSKRKNFDINQVGKNLINNFPML